MKPNVYICKDISYFLFINKLLYRELSFFDFSKKTINDFISDFSQISLFDKSGNIVIKNPDFIFDLFNKNKNYLNTFFSIIEKEKIFFLFDELNKTEKLSSDINFINLNNITYKNKYKIIKEILVFLNFNLSEEIQLILKNLLPDDFSFIYNEIKKLKDYSYTEQISKDNVFKVISSNLEKNVFKLIEWYFQKEKAKIFQFIINIDNQNEIFEIFRVLVAQIFNLKLIIIEYKKNPNFYSISQKMNIPYFFFTNWSKIIVSSTINNIDKLLENLLKLELDTYKNNLDFITNFKIFLIKDFN